jgi:carnitine-CoA ligase
MTGDSHLPFPLSPGMRTLPRMLDLAAERYGAKALFRCGDAAWSYDETPQIAARMAGRLASAGIRKGDRVAILSTNRSEVMRVLLGCGWLGAIAVPINAASKAPQIRYILENAGVHLLVAESSLLASIDAVAFSGLPLREIWTIGETVAVGSRPTSSFASDGPPDPAADVAPMDPVAILYTSGTTGAPKGVICPQAQFYWWGAYTSGYLELTDTDVLTTPLPLFHTNALNTFFQALLTGATQHVLPRFSVSDFWPALQRSGATVTYLLGAMVPMLLSRPPSPEERAHRVRVALAPGVPEHLHAAFFARTGIRFVDGYGSTETNFVIGSTASARVPGRMGRAGAGIALRVVNDVGASVPEGTPGELALKAKDPQAFSAGYFANPEKTAEAWRDGWFHSGDRVVQHADGTLSFLDRLKDSIRRRGENISSFEVEHALASHPAIAACAVFPVPSPLAEDEVMAAIVVKPGQHTSPQDLAVHCAGLLPRFAVPRYIDIVADLPRTENGKVQKFALRQRGVTAATWDREA